MIVGGYIDSQLNFKKHVSEKCKVAMLNIQRIKCIRSFLDLDACKIIMCGLVLSHLDYSNGMLYGLPKLDINRLQRVQSMAAKITLKRSKHSSVTEALKILHWLPVHWCIHGNAPSYLIDLIELQNHSRTLRFSSNYKLLKVPKVKRETFASRSFSVCGPILWNALPDYLRRSQSIDIFKKDLKTYMFLKF